MTDDDRLQMWLWHALDWEQIARSTDDGTDHIYRAWLAAIKESKEGFYLMLTEEPGRIFAWSYTIEGPFLESQAIERAYEWCRLPPPHE